MMQTADICWSITHNALGKWQNYLATMGIVLETRLDWRKGASSLYFRDPDGHSLELGTSGLWRMIPTRRWGVRQLDVKGQTRTAKPEKTREVQMRGSRCQSAYIRFDS
jgi:hypothetical protein